MKTRKLQLSLALVVGAMLCAGRSQAYYTNFLDVVSNTLTTAYNSITSSPTPTKVEKREAAAMKRALKDLSKPSTSVAGDYNLFLAAAQHLGPLAFSAQFAAIGSNVSDPFTNEAQAEIVATAARVDALNDFVPVKRAASKQVAKAQATLDSLNTLADPRIALIVTRVVFARITAANHLAGIGEAHPGFAANSLVGVTLHHEENNNNSGDVTFTSATEGTQTDSGGPQPFTYTYERTGLNTATLVLNEDGGGTTTVKLKFTSTTGGTFSFRHEGGDDRTQTGSGRFTLSL